MIYCARIDAKDVRMAAIRRIELRIPVEISVKLEIEGAKVGMTLPQYCVHLLADYKSNFANKRQDEMYDMIKALHDNYFDVD